MNTPASEMTNVVHPMRMTAAPMEIEISTIENDTPTASASILVATASIKSSLWSTVRPSSRSASSSSFDRLSRIMLPPMSASRMKAIHGAKRVTWRANCDPSSQPVSGMAA